MRITDFFREHLPGKARSGGWEEYETRPGGWEEGGHSPGGWEEREAAPGGWEEREAAPGGWEEREAMPGGWEEYGTRSAGGGRQEADPDSPDGAGNTRPGERGGRELPARGETDRRRARRRTARSLIHLARSFMRKMSRDKLDVYSAQAAFYLMMSLIPTLMLMFMFLKHTPLSEELILSALSEIIDENAMENVRRIVGNVYHGSVAIMSIASLTMLWIASRGILGLTHGLNSIYQIRENRNFFVLRLRSMFYTILLIFTLILSCALLVVSMRIREYLLMLFPFLQIHSIFLRIVLTVIGLVLMTGIFNILYVLLPNRKKRFASQLYGAVFTTVSWTIYTWGFMIYLSLASNLSIFYGGLMTLMVSMLWLYFCMYLFFFGAEVNAWKENPDSFPF